MKKIFVAALSISAASGAIMTSATTVQAQTPPSQSSFGGAVTFDNNNTAWSIENRSVLSETLSIRTTGSFANSNPIVGNRYGTSLNYNFSMEDEAKTFSPFVGAGIDYTSGNGQLNGFAQAGIDMYFENLILTGSVALPFSGDRGLATSIGLGFRF
jgi:hypothetical protein